MMKPTLFESRFLSSDSSWIHPLSLVFDVSVACARGFAKSPGPFSRRRFFRSSSTSEKALNAHWFWLACAARWGRAARSMGAVDDELPLKEANRWASAWRTSSRARINCQRVPLKPPKEMNRAIGVPPTPDDEIACCRQNGYRFIDYV